MGWFGDSEELKSCKKKCNDDEEIRSKNEPGITDSVKGWFSGVPSMPSLPSMPSFSGAQQTQQVQAGGGKSRGKRHRQRRYKHKGGSASATATPTIKPFYNSAVASGATYISGVPTAPVKMAGGRRKSKGKRRTMRGGYRYYDINTNNKITPLVKYAYSVKNLTGGKRRSTKKRRHSK
jgi:hypothetical protein